MTKEIIGLKDYITASGAYPDRMNDKELTSDYKDNAVKLLNKVNQLLTELGITSAKVSSGFRPSSVNAATANSAKKSLHMICQAIDILDDKDQSLSKLILTRPDLLDKYELWIEDPASTVGKNTNWVHIDCGVRSARQLRMFKV